MLVHFQSFIADSSVAVTVVSVGSCSSSGSRSRLLLLFLRFLFLVMIASKFAPLQNTALDASSNFGFNNLWNVEYFNT